jgi:ArsR family transcriptional regulator
MDANRLVQALKSLGDPTRLRVFDMLMEGVQCNCEIAERLDLSLSLISHHVRVLREAGLVRSERDPDDARWIYNTARRAG